MIAATLNSVKARVFAQLGKFEYSLCPRESPCLEVLQQKATAETRRTQNQTPVQRNVMTRLQKVLRIHGDVVRNLKCGLWQSSPVNGDAGERIAESFFCILFTFLLWLR